MLIVTYNIQYSLGSDGRYDLARSLATVRDADIICLQEVERNWRRSGMADQPAQIAAMMPDRFSVYASQFDADASYRDAAGNVVNRRRQFGQMTLSRWPIVAARSHVFPKRDTGARMNLVTGALETVIDTPGEPLRLFNLHLSDAATDERMEQIRYLMDLLRRTPDEGGIWNGTEADAEHWETNGPPSPMPLNAILLGDFNAEPNSAEYAAMLRYGTQQGAAASGPEDEPCRFVDAWSAAGNDVYDGITYRTNPIQGADWDQRLDYCFVPCAMAHRLKRAWIDRGAIASDHQPVWVEL